jgi:hypothetical protein
LPFFPPLYSRVHRYSDGKVVTGYICGITKHIQVALIKHFIFAVWFLSAKHVSPIEIHRQLIETIGVGISETATESSKIVLDTITSQNTDLSS